MKTGQNLSISRKMVKDLENFRGLFSRSHENLNFNLLLNVIIGLQYIHGLKDDKRDSTLEELKE